MPTVGSDVKLPYILISGDMLSVLTQIQANANAFRICPISLTGAMVSNGSMTVLLGPKGFAS